MERAGGLVRDARGVKAKVGILISGRGSNMAALVEAARRPDCPYEVALVFSNVLDAPGLALAQAAGVPTAALDHRGHGGRAAFDAKVDALLREAGCEWLAFAGYMRILSPEFVAKWPGRMLNIHPSLLPAFPGLDPHGQALAAGVKISGCTVHVITDELDGGPIVGQEAVPVLDGDTRDTLAERIHAAEHRLYPRALADLVSRSAP